MARARARAARPLLAAALLAAAALCAHADAGAPLARAGRRALRDEDAQPTAAATSAGGKHLSAVPDWGAALAHHHAANESQHNGSTASAAIQAQKAAIDAAVTDAAQKRASARSAEPAGVEATASQSAPLASGEPVSEAAAVGAAPAAEPLEAVPQADAAGGDALGGVGGAEGDVDVYALGPRAGSHARDGSAAAAAAAEADDAGAAAAAAAAAAAEAHATEAAAVAAERCPGGCGAHGNCDAENGVCDCPLGAAGAHCEQALLGACELVTGYVTPCGGVLTSCACLDACAALYGFNARAFEGDWCLVAPPPRDANGAPAAPEALEAYLAGKQRAAAPSSVRSGEAFPVSLFAACGSDRCGGHGVCRAGARPTCSCLPGWLGAGCETPAPVPCLNDCSGRGACTPFGWCACAPGFWGDDCALSRDAAGATRLWSAPPDAAAHVPRPRVYIYHLPGRYSAWHAHRRVDRPVEEMLHERFASSAHRVASGSDADLFFIPLPLRKLQTSPSAGAMVLEAVELLRTRHPFFNARGGAGHLLVTVSDMGPADVWPEPDATTGGMPALLANVSLLTHHGFGGDGAAVADAASFAPSLFRRGIDVVVPPLQSWTTGFMPAQSPLLGGPAPPRDTILFWAGAVFRPRNGRPVPHNMRAAVYDAHKDVPGFLLRDTATDGTAANYGAVFASSRFCLAPAGKGGGWGRRATLAALYGCIPLRIQDATADALDELLDWESFSVRIDEEDVLNLPAILEAIPAERVAAMQAQLACAWPRWLFSSVLGAYGGEDGGEDAASSVLELLWRRVRRAAGDATAMPAAPCALREERAARGCAGAALPALPGAPAERSGVAGEAVLRAQPAPWPAGGAACAGAPPAERPCPLPRGVRPGACAHHGEGHHGTAAAAAAAAAPLAQALR
jgi:hypothetical protein